VEREGDLYVLDFPARPATECTVHPRLVEALGATLPSSWPLAITYAFSTMKRRSERWPRIWRCWPALIGLR